VLPFARIERGGADGMDARIPDEPAGERSRMGATDPTTDPPATRDDPPEFDLDYRFDDPEDPGEVTVFPAREDADITTEWITVATGDAVSLREIK
jgi:hypothetical protein